MRKLLLILIVTAVFAFAMAETKDDLIALDKEWGVANLKADKETLGRIYADDLISVGPQGYSTKAEMLDVQPADSTNYVTSDYEVKMLGDDYAVMAHKGEGYSSLHVFAKRGGGWQVVATATVPMADN